ncbi:MAG: SOS response-associated peptidase [Gemmataceae bacterium]
MCGRFTVRQPPAEVAKHFSLFDDIPDFPPNYNAAPTQTLPVVREGKLDLLRWGLIPFWATDAKIAYHTINAKGETVAEKPAFRAAFKKRRCLVPADGFIEWLKDGPKTKRPYLIGLKRSPIFAFAGLWESWNKQGELVESFTIITTAANELLGKLHDRMPVILHPADYDRWQHGTPEEAKTLLQPFPADHMMAVEVSPRVNNVKFNDAACLESTGCEL